MVEQNQRGCLSNQGLIVLTHFIFFFFISFHSNLQTLLSLLHQIGMFCFSGLNKAQSQAMIEKHHIYLTGDGRISMAGLNTHNIEYVAKAIDDVVRNVK